jgi:hypothetical protein
MACQNLNHGLANNRTGDDDIASLLFHSNGSLLLRAMTTDTYTRIWNYEVAQRLLELQGKGWEPAVPDFNAFQGSQTALYASDRDMFAFMRLKRVTIAERGSDEPIYRGLIVWNSEVGDKKLGAMRFMYRYMCGNHIIWGASDVCEVSVKHVGDIKAKWLVLAAQIRRWTDDSVSEEEGKIAESKTRLIAATKEEVLDAIFGKRAINLSRRVLNAGYEAVNQDQDGDPRTAWGLVQGLTRHSQTVPYAAERTEIDRAAGRILEVVF